MVSTGLAVFASLVAVLTPPPGVDQALWHHLLRWQATMSGATNLVSERGTKTETDFANGRTKTYEATVWFLKPNSIRLRLDRTPPGGQKPDPSEFETYICNDRSVFHYDGATRSVTEYTRGPNGLLGGTPLLALVGLPAEENPVLTVTRGDLTARQLARRYAVRWIKRDDPTYLIFELTPLRPEDQREWQMMTLVLIKPELKPPLDQFAYLPRLAKIVRTNGQGTVSWDFPEPKANATKANGQPITAADFEFVAPGPDWKVYRAKPPLQPGPQPADQPRCDVGWPL